MQNIGFNYDRADVEEEAQSLIQGCKVHFKNSTERLSRNHAVVGMGDNGQFFQQVMNAVDIPMEEAFHNAINVLRVSNT